MTFDGMNVPPAAAAALDKLADALDSLDEQRIERFSALIERCRAAASDGRLTIGEALRIGGALVALFK